jgi:hypothetical protein
MTNTFFDRISHKYTSRWLVLSIDIYLTTQSFILAHIIIYGLEFNSEFIYILPIIVIVSLFCFLLIGFSCFYFYIS